MRGAHKTIPDLQGAGSAGQASAIVIVTPHPGHRHQVIREAGKPAVTQIIGGTGLTSQPNVRRHMVISRAAGPLCHHMGHRLLSQVDGRRIKTLTHLKRIPFEWLALRRQHVANGAQRRIEAAIGNGLIHVGHLHRRHRTRAQQHGRVGRPVMINT